MPSSFCPSVRLSHLCIVSTSLNMSAGFFHYLVTTSNTLPQRIRFWQNSDWVVPNWRDRKIRQFPDPNTIWTLEQCNPWPHVANRHISISELLSLSRHSHYDVIRASRAYGAGSPRSHYDINLIMTSRAYGARSPRSHYDVILIVTSFATELATPTVTDVRYARYVRTP